MEPPKGYCPKVEGGISRRRQDVGVRRLPDQKRSMGVDPAFMSIISAT